MLVKIHIFHVSKRVDTVLECFSNVLDIMHEPHKTRVSITAGV